MIDATAYAAAFRALHLPATLIDAAGTIVDVNDAFLEHARRHGHDLRREERLGRPIWEFAGVDHPHLGRAAIFACLAGQDCEPVQLRERDLQGREGLHELRLHRLCDAGGQTTGALITRQEVTGTVRQARQLESSVALVSAFGTVGHLVLSSLDVDVILETIAREVVKAGIFRSVTLALVDEDQHCIEVVRSIVRQVDADGRVGPGAGLRNENSVLGLRYDLDDDNIMAEVARRGEMVVTAGKDPRFDLRVEKPDTPPRCCYFIPVRCDDRVLAVIATGSPPDERDEMLERIEAMAPLLDQVALALEHARLYRQIQRSEHEARVRLGVERVRAQILLMETEQDWRRVVAVLRRELRALIRYTGCGINLVSDSGVTAYGAGSTVQDAVVLSRVPPALRQALDTRRPVYRPTQEEMRRLDDGPGLLRAGVRSVVDVPFETGTLAVNSTEPEAFSDADIAVIGQFAAVLSEGHRRLEDLQTLAAKNRQLQQAQKMEAIGQLSAGIAHNFNNMLQAITGNLELARGHATPQGQGFLDHSVQTCQRAARMVQQLMAFSRQRGQPVLGVVDVIHVLGDVEAICRRTFDRRIGLGIDVADDLPHVHGDGLQLEQAILNLCINARDALEEGAVGDPRIRIEAAAMTLGAERVPRPAGPGNYLRLRVGDNGPGMDAATRQRVFEPFFTTKEVGRGTGLGLSTAHGIVQDHGGWIECDSTPGGGTRFDVFLPVTTAPYIQPESGPIMSAGRGHETILVIDDEDMVRNTAAEMLRRRGFNVLSAADGEAGLALFDAHGDGIDLVLLDHSMPRLSGLETLRALRQRSESLRVVIITGFPAGLEEFEGADDLLQKPFSLMDLVGRVRGVLDQPR